MKTSQFISQLDRSALETAIEQAEQQTSGEIRVAISRQAVDDPIAAARAEFEREGMEKTRLRNAVLLFIAPDSQGFAIIGDAAIHAKCGDSFWRDVADAMQSHLRAGHYTAALVEGIARSGALLAAHFPRQPGDANELSDQVVGH
jgi:uncharacterized membrane protein